MINKNLQLCTLQKFKDFPIPKNCHSLNRTNYELKFIWRMPSKIVALLCGNKSTPYYDTWI